MQYFSPLIPLRMLMEKTHERHTRDTYFFILCIEYTVRVYEGTNCYSITKQDNYHSSLIP